MTGISAQYIQFQCGKCKQPLPPKTYDPLDRIELNTCPSCGSAREVFYAFPALQQIHQPAQAGERIADDSEASCYNHPGKRAEKSCDQCGRFICGLCEVAMEGRHLCPDCLTSGREKGKLATLTDERVLYDNIALGLAFFPILIFWLTFLGAPAALYVCIRYWNAPLGLLKPRRRWRFILAGTMATLQICGWIVIFFTVFREATNG